MISKAQSGYVENRITFENRGRENFDEENRDYNIVLMHENESYKVNELAEIANLDKSTISKIIHAWQDIPEDARKALEDRKITTNHARQLARVKAWPKEQIRLTKWLLDDVEKSNGVSSTQLGMIVNSVVERKKHAKFVADDVELTHRMGTADAGISEKTYDELRAKMSKKFGKQKITKKVMKQKITKKVMKQKITKKVMKQKITKNAIKEDHRSACIERVSRAALENIEQEVLQVLHESVVRYGGAGQVSVRSVSRVVSKRVKGLKNDRFLKRSVCDVLENLSWASFWDYGYQTTGANNRNLAGRIYALEMELAELARVKEQLIQRGPIRTPGSRDFRNLRKRMLRILSEEFPLSPKELAERFEEAYDRIGSQLHHMVKRGELVRPKSGFYCLPGQLNEARKRIEEKHNPPNPHSILEILSEAFPQSTEQIARRLNTGYSLVRNTLNRLARQGELTRIRSGFYCLPNQVAEVKRELRAERKVNTYSELLGLFSDDSVLTPKEVARKLGKNPFSVQSTMSRLVKSGNLVRVRRGFYCLTTQVKSRELQSIRNRSRETAIAAIASHSGSKNDQTQFRTGNSTIAKAMAQVLQLLLYSPRMTLMQIVVTSGMSESTISKATERLMDLSVLTGDESDQVSIAPQEDPETIRMIQMVGEKGLDEAIRALVVEYLQRQLDKTQKHVFNMRQLKKYVRERLQFLTAWEFRREMAPVLERFTSNGVIESLDGDVYEFSPLVAEASA